MTKEQIQLLERILEGMIPRPFTIATGGGITPTRAQMLRREADELEAIDKDIYAFKKLISELKEPCLP